jgi:hypothetical protein
MDMVEVVGEITPWNFTVKFNKLSNSLTADNGGDNISKFLLEWQQVGAATWTTLALANYGGTDTY